MVKSIFRYLAIAVVNIIVFVALVAPIEMYYRYHDKSQRPFGEQVEAPGGQDNGLWQEFRPYIMFTTVNTLYKGWSNQLTGETIPANVTTNSLGFRDDREFTPASTYRKAPNEKVVLFTGGSVAWGVGASENDRTVPGRIEHYLNLGAKGKTRYTVINLGMGSFIAFQQYIALSLYGVGFDPDWVVVMDGFNDAFVACKQSQGSYNPMFFSIMKMYLDGYLLGSEKPVMYRGRVENWLLKHSAAVRAITGQAPIYLNPLIDKDGESEVRQVIQKAEIGETARNQLAFYLRAEALTASLFPKANVIFSTQPMVNDFRGDFTKIYDYEVGSPERNKAISERVSGLEHYLEYNKSLQCGVKTSHPADIYILVNGALGLERLASELNNKNGRHVEYINTGTLMPNNREERIPYFIDGAHLTDKGMDLLGKYYATRILLADGLSER